MAQSLSLGTQMNQRSTSSPHAMGPAPIVLRSSGRPPLHVTGELIAECSSWTASAPAWHDLTIFACDTGEIAVAMRTSRGDSGEGDVFRAKIFPTLDEATKWLQDLDPTADIVVDIDAADRRVSGADIALRAASLRMRMDHIKRLYQSMIGELLYRLDLGT